MGRIEQKIVYRDNTPIRVYELHGPFTGLNNDNSLEITYLQDANNSRRRNVVIDLQDVN